MSRVNYTDKYIISLICSVINSTTPAEFSNEIDWDIFIKTASEHHVSNLLWYAIEKLNNKPPRAVCDVINQEHIKALMRDATQQAEAEHIISGLSTCGIRSLPLKGYHIKKYYPSSDMRYMSDFDILIDAENADKVRNVLEDLGYTFEFCGKVHDNYVKKPITHIEVHKYMMDDDMYNIAEYYNSTDGFSRGERISDYSFEYALSDEEFYIYMISHSAKHYLTFGTGILSIVDIHIFLRKFGSMLDWNYIDNELKKLKLTKLNEQLIALSKMWFSDGKNSKLLQEMGDYIISSGSYGKLEHDVLNKFLNKGKSKKSLFCRKIKYFFFMIFPNVEYMSGKYPKIKNKPFLLPLYWVKRWFSSLLFNRESIRLRLFSVLRTKKSVVELHSKTNIDS